MVVVAVVREGGLSHERGLKPVPGGAGWVWEGRGDVRGGHSEAAHDEPTLPNSRRRTRAPGHGGCILSPAGRQKLAWPQAAAAFSRVSPTGWRRPEAAGTWSQGARSVWAGGPGGAPAGWAESAQETPAAVSSRAWLVTAQRVQGNGRASLRKSEME